jgi:NAD(P)-dependent dehydrogenase (short-subunit alcohol dehydrogenase family)
MAGRLTDKVAFITGAARGQGRAHAVRMAREGADIIAVDIAGKLPSCVRYDSATPDDLAETVRLVEAAGRRIMASATDVRDFDALRQVVETAWLRSGGWTSSSPMPASRLRRRGTRSLPNRFAT